MHNYHVNLGIFFFRGGGGFFQKGKNSPNSDFFKERNRHFVHFFMYTLHMKTQLESNQCVSCGS